MSDSASVNEFGDYLDHDLGGVDILVGNAGADTFEFVGEITESEAERVLRVNLISNIMLTNRLLPGMRRKKWGRIIFSSSICGVLGTANEGLSVYGASKAGLDGFMKYVAAEAGPDGITANCLTIGMYQTDMMQEYADGDVSDTFIRGYLGMTALGRMGKPSDMAGIVQLLASDAGAYITGATIPVDGGIVSTLRPNVKMSIAR
jgi:NAD(P)-dependent dehydrogenase (short-subunit alcohol dehydrogenase family)